MKYTDQMATKLLAQTSKALGDAINEALCASPDKGVVLALINQVQDNLREFEDAYFDDE